MWFYFFSVIFLTHSLEANAVNLCVCYSPWNFYACVNINLTSLKDDKEKFLSIYRIQSLLPVNQPYLTIFASSGFLAISKT